MTSSCIRTSFNVPIHTMEAYRGSERPPPLILNLNIRGERSTSRPGRFTPLPSGKKFRHPLNRWVDGLRSRSGPFGAQKNILLLAGFESRIVQPTSSRINTSELQK